MNGPSITAHQRPGKLASGYPKRLSKKIGGRGNSVEPTKYGQVGCVCIESYAKRICSSLRDKANKFERYLEKGVVKKEDLAVIAISVSEIDGIVGNMDESMRMSLYAEGGLVVQLAKQSGQIVGGYREKVTMRKKKSNALINAEPFVDGSMPHISAVLASQAHALCPGLEPLGWDYVLYPNLLCTNRWPEKSILLGTEWLVESVEWNLKRFEHSSGMR